MIDPINLIPAAATLLFGSIAAWTDWHEGSIYDGTTIPMMGLGLLISIFLFVMAPILLLIQLVITVLIFFAGKWLMTKGGVGGGDIKLLMGYNLIYPFSALVILPLALLFATILTLGQRPEYVRLGPLALISFLLILIIDIIF